MWSFVFSLLVFLQIIILSRKTQALEILLKISNTADCPIPCNFLTRLKSFIDMQGSSNEPLTIWLWEPEYLLLDEHVGGVPSNPGMQIEIRRGTNITIMPFECKPKAEAECTVKALLFLKTVRLRFLIKGSLTLKNIVFDGSDMNLPSNYRPSCYNSQPANTCCNDENMMKTNSPLNPCGLLDLKVSRVLSRGNRFVMFEIGDEPNNSSLALKYIFFKNFINVIDTPSMSTLIGIALRNTNVLIENTVFSGCYLEDGIFGFKTRISSNANSILNMNNVSFLLYNRYRIDESVQSILAKYMQGGNYFLLLSQTRAELRNCVFSDINTRIMYMELQSSVNLTGCLFNRINLTGIFTQYHILKASRVNLVLYNTSLINSTLRAYYIDINSGSLVSIEGGSIMSNLNFTFTAGGFLLQSSSETRLSLNRSVFSFINLESSPLISLIDDLTLNVEACNFMNVITLKGTFSIILQAQTNNKISIVNSLLKDLCTDNPIGLVILGTRNTFLLKNSSILNISNKADGGFILSSDNNNITIDNLKAQLFRTDGFGGILMAQYNTNVTIYNCVFTDLEARNAALVGAKENNTIRIIRTRLSYLKSSNVGAVITTLNRNNISIFNLVGISLTSKGSGGIFFIQRYNKIVLSNIFLYDTLSAGSGLIFGMDENNINLTDFVVRKQEGDGGIIELMDRNVLLIFNIYGYSIVSGRGSLLSCYTANNLTMNSIFLENVITKRGVLYCTSENNINLKQFYLHESVMESTSSIVILSNNKFLFEELVIKGSSAPFGAAFIFQTSNQGAIYSSVLKSIVSESNGVVYFLNFNTVQLFNITFEATFSSDTCAGIYLYSNNEIHMQSLKFDRTSTMLEGAACYCFSENTVVVIVAEFYNTRSLLNGGAFFLYSHNTLNLRHCFFSHITSGDKINTIYLSNSNKFTFLNLTFYGGVQGISLSYFNKGSIKDIVFTSPPSVCASIRSAVPTANLTKPIVTFSGDSLLSLIESELTAENISFYCQEGVTLIESMRSNLTVYGLNVKNVLLKDPEYFLVDVANSTLTLIKGSSLNSAGSFISLVNSNASIIRIKEKNRQLNSIFTQNSILELKNSHFRSLAEPKGFILTKRTYIIAQFSTLTIEKTDFIEGLGTKGGAVFIYNTDIIVRFCLFALNKAKTSGAGLLYRVDELDHKFELKGNLFANNAAGVTGGAISLEGCYKAKNFKMESSRNIFMRNTAFIGGALGIDNVGMFSSVRDYFLKNKGVDQTSSGEKANSWLGKGGAIHITWNKFPSGGLIKFFRSIFWTNSAAIGGAIYLADNPIEKKILMPECDFYGNNAKSYGQDLASPVAELTFHSFYQKTLITTSLEGLVSGHNYTSPLCIFGYDYYGNMIMGTDQDILDKDTTITNSSETLVMKRTSHGFYCLEQTIIRFPRPNLNLIYSFFLNASYLPIKKRLEGPTLLLYLQFRPCSFGEHGLDSGECQTCPEQTFSLDPKGLSPCIPCKEDDPYFCFGGANLTPRENFWRISYYSMNFIRCPALGSCKGFNFSNPDQYTVAKATGECSKGYKGALCTECEEGYGSAEGYLCAPCDEALLYVKVIGAFLIKLILILFSVHKALIMCISLINSNIVNLRKVISSNLMKILFNYLQCMIYVLSFKFYTPVSVDSIVTISKSTSPNMTTVISLECFLKNLRSSLTVHYFKLIIIWVSPFFLSFVGNTYLWIYLQGKKSKFVIDNREDRVRIWKSISYTVLMITFPDYIQVCLETFSCLNIGFENNDDFRLVKDYSTRCWDNEHVKWSYGVALPFLLIFGFGFPFFILIKLTWHWKTRSLNDKKELLKYGYFYFGYDKQFFFWDFVILFRKIGIVSVNIFYQKLYGTSRYANSAIIIFAILFLGLLIHMEFKPYRRDKLNLINSLEKKSLIALAATIYFGITGSELTTGEAWRNIFFCSIVILNLNFIVPWLMAFFSYAIKTKLRKWKVSLIGLGIKIKACYMSLKKLSDATRKKELAELEKNYALQVEMTSNKMARDSANLLESIRRSTYGLRRKETISVHQPKRMRCKHCEISLSIEEDNQKLRDEMSLMKGVIAEKEKRIRSLQRSVNALEREKGELQKRGSQSPLPSPTLPYSNKATLPKTQSSFNKQGKRESDHNPFEGMKKLRSAYGDTPTDFEFILNLKTKSNLLDMADIKVYGEFFLYQSKDEERVFFLKIIVLVNMIKQLSDPALDYEYERELFDPIIIDSTDHTDRQNSLDNFIEHTLIIKSTNFCSKPCPFIGKISADQIIKYAFEIPYNFNTFFNFNITQKMQYDMIIKTEKTYQINSGEMQLNEENFYKTLVESGIYKNLKKVVVNEETEEYYGLIEYTERALVYYYKIIKRKNSICFNFVLNHNKSSILLLEFFEQSFRAIFKLVSIEKEKE